MKNLVFALSLALASSLAFAEPETAEGDSPRGKPPHPFGAIELTDEQKEEMQKIKEAGGSREEIWSVLTPEQQEEIRGSSSGAKREGDGRGKIDRLRRKLNLSDEQVAEMEKIREGGGSRQEMFEVLTDEQREKLREGRGQRRPEPRPEPDSA